MATKTLTPDGTSWPTHKSVKNLESYDAADDETVAQANANADQWLKERATRIQDRVFDTDSNTYTGVGSDDWQDTDIETTLTDQTAGDILTVWVSFEGITEGTGADQYVYFRLKIVDGSTTTFREAIMLAPNGSANASSFCLIAQREIDTSGSVVVTLQTKNSGPSATAVTTAITDADILPVVERRKADDT